MSVSIAASFHLILAWSIMVVEECCSLVDLYTGIRDGSIEVPSALSKIKKTTARLHGILNNS